MAEQYGQPGPAAGAAALDRPLRDAQHLGDLSHRVPLEVEQNQGGPLVGRELGERRPDREPGVVVGSGSTARAAGLHLGQRHGRPGLPSAGPVQAGVDDDPVQPGGDRGRRHGTGRRPGRRRSARPAGRRPPPPGRPGYGGPPPTTGRGGGGRARRTRPRSPPTCARSSARVVDVGVGTGHGETLSGHGDEDGDLVDGEGVLASLAGSGGSLVIQISRYCMVCWSGGTGNTMTVPGLVGQLGPDRRVRARRWSCRRRRCCPGRSSRCAATWSRPAGSRPPSPRRPWSARRG